MSKASVWHPYNVELVEEPEAEAEADDTQEIQIEEALKLYQTALKYHSEGPESFEKTAAAYKALFDSDIFKYTESLSEYHRHEVFGEELVFDSILEDDFEAGPVQSTGAADSAPNTLPQILHLSYKNHGQFLLESMQHWIILQGVVPQLERWTNTRGALNYFAEALDKEDTDLDLWLRAASVAAMLGSKRLTRYCLEAVLDGNDEQWESLLQLPGLEEAFAGQQLRELVERLEDTVSLTQIPALASRKQLSHAVKQHLNPFAFAPLPADVANLSSHFITTRLSEKFTLPLDLDWAGVGEFILQQYQAEQRGMTLPRSAALGSSAIAEQPVPPQSLTTTEIIAEVETPEIVPGPSRKRSTDSAGLPENAEGGRSRSKRIRGRDTIIETSIVNRPLDEKLGPYIHADDCLYEIVKDIYSRLGVEGIHQPSELRDLVTTLPEASATNPVDQAACDLFSALKSGEIHTARVLLSSESFDLLGLTREAGLNAFLGFAKPNSRQTSQEPLLESQRLDFFTRQVNDQWLTTKDVAFAWVEFLLSQHGFPAQPGMHLADQSGFMQFRWGEDLKRNFVQVIVNIDDYIYERMLDRVDSFNRRMLEAYQNHQAHQLSAFESSQLGIVETLFELHLDVYSLIKHPHSQVDAGTQTTQSDRLERWSTLARDAMQLRSDCQPSPGMDDLSLRHIWASVFQMSVNEDVLAEHVVSAMADLKSLFQVTEDHSILIQNNAVMPELSVAAIDRELVRISMKDFFLKVFDQEETDPVTVIENLEPILEQASIDLPGKSAIPIIAGQDYAASSTEAQQDQASPILEMRKFLDSANVNVRLSLWQRLRVAYEAIEYPPKVVSCYLRSIEVLVTDFKSSNFQQLHLPDRQVKLLTRFCVIDDLVVKIIRIVRDEESAFDCLSYEHVQSSMTAIARLLYILSASNILQDLIILNQVPVPRVEGLQSQAFANMTIRLGDLHLRLWMLQYHLLKEGMRQNSETFPTPSEDLFEFVRHIHHATGVRHFCHLSARQFLRLAKDELLRLDNVIDGHSYDNELCQVLHDLYGLKLFIDPIDCQDFQAMPDVLDKRTALSILPFVMSQANKVDPKDLPKSDLRNTIEKVHTALGRPKQHEAIASNRKVISTYLKSPIKPMSLFNSLKGVGLLPTKQITAEEAVAASKGWYYLMGNIALSKFRSQKRMTQGPTEDLHYAQAFFVQDLEFSTERWETWYRLAQANDAQLEEAVSWNADKLNSNSVELLNFQRAAFNCYTMAVACSIRDASPAFPIQAEIAQMYADFGNRVYASSREPFNMDAFQIRENEKRYCNKQEQAGTYTSASFLPLQPYTAWKFASTLFKRAIKGNPKNWWNYYMLGKCRWKMWSANDREMSEAVFVGAPPPPSPQSGPTWEEVIAALISAIDTLPGKKGRSGEPVLEPHYKLVSITHKLLQRKAIDQKRGVEILAHTSYSKNISAPENVDDWERYILAVLKSLRAADKSSWHHRIIARSAHIIYDDGKDTMMAHGAKHELTQQMFTKTMAVQVWKPENERPGRHFVYTTRYTKFFVILLDITGDKANFEALAKRVRRKQTDFFEHQKLWQELCSRYLKLLRKIGKVPEGQEDSVFKSVNHDDFNVLAIRLEAWCQDPVTQHPILDVLRDAIELKRMNNGLMKTLLIDDLIGDAYAMLYTYTLSRPSVVVQDLQESPNTHALSRPPVVVQDLQESPSTYALSRPSVVVQDLQESLTARPRVKAVGRREIGRRAEACVQKVTIVVPQITSIPIRSPPATHNNLPSISSVHEDADDESELSELNEDEVQEFEQGVGGDVIHVRYPGSTKA